MYVFLRIPKGPGIIPKGPGISPFFFIELRTQLIIMAETPYERMNRAILEHDARCRKKEKFDAFLRHMARQQRKKEKEAKEKEAKEARKQRFHAFLAYASTVGKQRRVAQRKNARHAK